MNRKKIAFILTAMLLSVTGCGDKEETPTKEVSEEIKVQQSEIEGMEKQEEIQEEGSETEERLAFSDADLLWVLPKGYQALDGEEGVYVHKSYPKDTSTVTYVISESETDFSDISKEEFQDLLEDDFYDAYGDKVAVEIDKYERSEIKGRTMLRIDFEYLFKGTEYEQTEVMIFNGDETHIINFIQEENGKWTEEFEKSIASFTFAE